jgi:hypothetical protein
MPITKLNFKPGINREGTQYAEQGSWYDCDKIRFRSGFPEKIGGWIESTARRFKGVCRVLMNWTLLNAKDCLFMGTNKKVYIEHSGIFYDITPIRFTNITANPITTGSTGGTTHTYLVGAAHNASVGDFVTISGSTEVDGICTDVYTNPFLTSAAGSTLVTVDTVTTHYASVDDVVTFSGTTGFDGIPAGNFNTALTIIEVLSSTKYIVNVATGSTAGFVTGGGTVTAVYLSRLNREFEILDVPTATTFTFATDVPCTTGGVNGGGATVTAAFQVSIGYAYNITGGGWSAGKWTRKTWSSAVDTSVSGINLRIWSVDNYGEDITFCPRDGALYYWDATNGFTTRGVLVSSLPGASDVPDQVSVVRVTDERHTLAIGATDRLTSVFDPLLVRWSDQEDITNWTPAITNTAGSIRVPMGSYVMAGITSRQETLIWTDHSLHSLQFIGPPYTFGLQTLAENTNIAGPNAAVNINNVTYWMGKSKFWMYSGRVQSLHCSVQRYVFDGLEPTQIAQVYASVNDGFTEVTWNYVSAGSSEMDRYVTYNYGDDLWTIGTIPRTSMQQCAGRGSAPYGTNGGYSADDGVLFLHENGYDDGSTNPPSAIEAYIESADMDIQDGNKLVFVDRVIPDLTFSRSTSDTPSAIFTIEAKKFSGQALQSSDSRNIAKTITQTVDQYTNQVWTRLRGRQIRLKVSSVELGVCWLLGTVRINLRQDGRQ